MCEWLSQLKLSTYAPAFRDAEVDGDVLLALTESVLREDFAMSGLHATKLLAKLGTIDGVQLCD